MDWSVDILYKIFLLDHPICVTSCSKIGDCVEIKIQLCKNTKPYTIILKPRD